MRRLRVLITNITLAHRTGTEINVRDLALALLARGHQPIVYSSDPGVVGEELARATVPVVSDLAAVGGPPDVIHGHHHPELVQALLHFPGVPAIFVSHDALAWHDAAPGFARIRRYLAVDEANFDRIVCQHGIPAERALVLHNAVDMTRFVPRPPLPPRPGRALVFSNYAREDTHLAVAREACARIGLPLEVVGAGVGRPVATPEALLGRYDLVFAKGRCALEALAVGAAVVLCDYAGSGPMVTSEALTRLMRQNFGRRLLIGPLDADALVREIARYDATDAAAVSRRIREEASLDESVERLLAIYQDVITEQAAEPADALAESRSLADYLRVWGPRFKDGPLRTEVEESRVEVERLTLERDTLLAARAALTSERDRLDAALQAARGELGACWSDLERARKAGEVATAEIAALKAHGAVRDEDVARANMEVGHLRTELSYLTRSATWRVREVVVRSPAAVALYRVLRYGVRLGRRLLAAPVVASGSERAEPPRDGRAR
jgi:Glycosyltransferase Family 4